AARPGSGGRTQAVVAFVSVCETKATPEPILGLPGWGPEGGLLSVRCGLLGAIAPKNHQRTREAWEDALDRARAPEARGKRQYRPLPAPLISRGSSAMPPSSRPRRRCPG